MSESKKDVTSEETDWADALDEWEQKAFSSVAPPPVARESVAPARPSVPPGPPASPSGAPPATAASSDATKPLFLTIPKAAPAPELADVELNVADETEILDVIEAVQAPPLPRASVFPPRASVPPPFRGGRSPAPPAVQKHEPPGLPDAREDAGDRTLASAAGSKLAGIGGPSAPPMEPVVDDVVVEAGVISMRDIELEDGDALVDSAPPVRLPSVPPPLPEGFAAATRPPALPALPVSPNVRIGDVAYPRDLGRDSSTSESGAVSITARALQALRTLGAGSEDDAVLSRKSIPSGRPLAPDVAALLAEQASWLEAEAGTTEEGARSGVLVALSEIHALLGDRPRAAALAGKARDLAPTNPLAHRQARALADDAAPGQAVVEAAALMAEEAGTPRPAAKQHAALLAADVLRLSGDTEGASLKLARVADTGDLRGVVGAVALGLARDDLEGLSSFLTRPEAAPLAPALTSTLRLRGLAVGEPARPGTADGVSDALAAARAAIAGGDLLAAARHVASLRGASTLASLANGASWLAAGLAATRAEGHLETLGWLTELAEGGDERAGRVLAARAVAAGDGPAASSAIARGGFSAADSAALTALLELQPEAGGADLAPESLPPELSPLAAAVSGVEGRVTSPTADDRAARTVRRAGRVVGSDASRAAVRMARLLSSGAEQPPLEAAAAALHATDPAFGSALEIELALRDGAYAKVSDRLRSWGSQEAAARPIDAHLAAGLVAERAGDSARGLAAYRDARKLDRSSEVALRAIAALDPSTDLPGDLNELADDLGATPRGALARLEAIIREDAIDDVTRADLLERAHRAAPSIPIASFLAERIAFRTRNVDDAIRWIEERRAGADDPIELGISTVREARLIAHRDPQLSAAKVAEVHRQFPNQLALREFYERTLATPAPDQASYWSDQAATVTGASRALLYLEVALACERAGDKPGTLRAAESLADDFPLLRLVQERAEIESGEAAPLVDQLLNEAKRTPDPVVQREAYERLAEIDGVGRGDTASALLWHNSILEEIGPHLPSLRYLEQALVGQGRDAELEPIAAQIAHELTDSDGGERVAHADLSARLRSRGPEGDWESTFDVAELAAKDPQPSLASLRLLHAHARVRKDDVLLIDVSQQLLDRATRPIEMAALRLRLAEAAFRESDLARALSSLEQATADDPGDLVAFRLLAEVRSASGDPVGAAEAHESVARLSLVPGHQLDAWCDAARLWLADPARVEQGTHALEQAAAIDLSRDDVFPRLSALYAAKGAYPDLAALLDRRIALATDSDERVTLEVERGRALLASNDRPAARLAVASALRERPDHTTALATFAELSALDEDWPAAEDAWVRLARLLATPDEQRQVYEHLGDLYATKMVHLERAELAFKEVLKRAPGHIPTLERLVDVYRRQNDVARAVEGQQELMAKAQTATEKRERAIELSAIYEDPGHDERKAEQVLDGARREFPTDVAVLRALAHFYIRHKQTPALNILLDRAAADARRAFAAGRFAPALFDVMRAIFELRGKDDAARIVGASLLAIEGKPADVRGAFGPALDPRIDDLLAPDVLSAGLRTVLGRAGSMLDVAAPIDLRAMAALPAGPEARIIHELAGSFAAGLGITAPKIYLSKTIGRTCLPAASDPPTLVIGESLLTTTNERAVAFIVMRAMKLVAAHASALVRTTSTDLAVLVPAWLQAVVPNWTPQGVNPSALAAAAKKIALSTPPALSEEFTSLGLEVASQLGTRASTLGALALAWANRAALLGVGDPNAALDALAWSLGNKDGAPSDPTARAAWIGRTHEAKDLLIFSIGDAYAEARVRLELR